MNGPLDMLPATEDPTGRGERAWDIMARLPITEGEHAGKRIGENAPPWMPRLVKLIFGHVDQGGHRMLREVFVNIAKKNGKTSAAAALALTFLLLDEAPREQVLFVAATLDQAHIAFNSMAAMIEIDPWLGERFRVIQHRNTIEYSATRSTATAVAAELASLVGRNPSLTIFDELHLLAATPKGTRLVNQARNASVGRREPLILSISTAPLERSEGIFESTRAKARRVIAGEEVDPHFFAWLCECPKGLDPQAPENWHWTNPSLGYMIDHDRLKALLAGSQSDPATLRDFLSQNLNVSPESSSGEGKWMAQDKWDRGADRTISLEAVINEAISLKVGIDKGGQDDLSAIAVLGRCNRGEGDHFLLWTHQWISRDGYEKRKSVIPYDDFVAEGGLTVVERVTDDVPEMADVAALAYASGKLSLVGIDSYCSPSVVKGLVETGIPEDIVQSVKQGGHLQPAIFFIEESLATGRLQHNGSAVMRWNIFNAVLTRRGPAVSISKSSVVGSDKIDGVAALLNAAAAHLAKQNDDVGIYMEQNGGVRPMLYLDLG